MFRTLTYDLQILPPLSFDVEPGPNVLFILDKPENVGVFVNRAETFQFDQILVDYLGFRGRYPVKENVLMSTCQYSCQIKTTC